jgi:hypothetical protein
MDADERSLERHIRAILRVSTTCRMCALSEQVASRLRGFQVESGIARLPISASAQPGEPWKEYHARTGENGSHGEWFVSRLLSDARIGKVLTRAGCVFVIADQ